MDAKTEPGEVVEAEATQERVRDKDEFDLSQPVLDHDGGQLIAADQNGVSLNCKIMYDFLLRATIGAKLDDTRYVAASCLTYRLHEAKSKKRISHFKMSNDEIQLAKECIKMTWNRWVWIQFCLIADPAGVKPSQ